MATLTIQPSTADNHIRQNDSDTNNGVLTYLSIGDDSGDYRRSILKFDFSALVPGCTISEAKLYLYYYDKFNDPVGRTYWAYRLTQRDWTETGSTWNRYATGLSWATAGGDYTATDGASAVVPAGYGWMNWTVTTQVQFAQASTGKVAHFLMKDNASVNNAGIFYSNNYTTDTAKCPYLILTYTASGWAHAKNGVVALSNSKINGLVPATGVTSVDGIT